MKKSLAALIFFSAFLGLAWAAEKVSAFHLGASTVVNQVRLSESHSSSGAGPNGTIGVSVSTNNVFTSYYWAKVLAAQVDGDVRWSNYAYGYGTGHSYNAAPFSGLGGGDHRVGGDAKLYYWNGSRYVFWSNLSVGPATVNIPSPPPPFDFSLSNSGNISVNPGGSGSNTITASLTSGSSQSVSFSASGLPFQASASGLSSCNPTCSRTLTVFTSAQTPTGTFPITVSSGGKSTSFTLTVNAPTQPFDYSIRTEGNKSVAAGFSITNTVYVTRSSGATQAVSLSIGGLPYQGTASFSPASCAPNDSCTSTVTLNASPLTPPGMYPITITGSLLNKTTSFNLTVTEAFNYSLSIDAPSTAVAKGYSFARTITVTKTAGPTQSVSLSASGLPYQAEASFSPASCSPSNTSNTCASTVTVTTSPLTPNGTSQITFTGSPLSKSAPFSMVVVDQDVAFNFTASPNSGNTPVSSTLTANVTGGSATGPINYNFWWNCSYTGSSMSGAESACESLQTPSWGSCASNSNGYKCNGISATTQSVTRSYTCNTTSCSYTPKVIIERGLAPAKQAQATVSVSVPAVSASCSADKTKATLNESVKWSATASGGGGGYTYAWGGTWPLAGKTGSSVSVVYIAAGNKTGSVTVTSGSQSKTVNCSNAVDVYMPVLKISPNNARLKVNETKQFAVDYYPYGLSVIDTKQDITTSAYWFSSSNKIATVNDTSKKGLVTGVKAGSVNIYASYTDEYGNLIATRADAGTTAAVTVTEPTPLEVSIKTHPNSPGVILVNQDITFEAKYGVGGYKWSGGGTPASDPSGRNSEFTTKYTSAGSKTVTVTSGSQMESISFPITAEELVLNKFDVTPTTGQAPLNVDLFVKTTSNIPGTANYSFWWNCSYAGASVNGAKAQCGDLPEPVAGKCVSNSAGAKCNGITDTTLSLDRNFNAGNYTAKVIIERGSLALESRKSGLSYVAVDITTVLGQGPVTVSPGERVDLKWTSSNADTCAASGDWSGSKMLNRPVQGVSPEQTPPINEPRDYTFTLTCKNAASGVSARDSVVARTSSFVRVDELTGTAGAGSTAYYLHGVDLRADISTNITGVTSNYTYYCNRSDSGTNIGGSWSVKRDGVDAAGDYDTAVDACNYNPGSYTAKVIVERGSSVSEKRLPITVSEPPPNNPPSVTPLPPTAPSNYCVSPFGWTLNWNFSDTYGETQSAYQIVVRDASSGAAVKDTGQVNSSSNSYSIPVGTLDFNKTYSWTIKVWDNNANPLTAQQNGTSFTTIKHAAPALSFNISPLRPSRDEQVTLTDTTVVSGGASKANWNWDFTGVDGVTLLSPASAPQVVVKFSTSGSKNVKLKVTDSDGLNCQKGANDDANDSLPGITVGRGIPSFKEVLPR